MSFRYVLNVSLRAVVEMASSFVYAPGPYNAGRVPSVYMINRTGKALPLATTGRAKASLGWVRIGEHGEGRLLE